MGRGRSKARQTKVARNLKYQTEEIDIEKLSKELHGEEDQKEVAEDFDPFAEGNYIQRN